MRPFAVYPASFDGDTLGWWRFGERGGRLDGVIGPAMAVAAGAPTPTDRGYLYAVADQHTAALPGQPLRTEGTIECWFRCDGPENGFQHVFGYSGTLINQNFLALIVRRQIGTGLIRVQLKVANVTIGLAEWIGAAARAMLDSPEMIHVAGTFDSVAGYCRLFVNGVQRAEDLAGITAQLADNYTVRVPRIPGYTGLVDEVRVSSISRYVGGADGTRYFTPARFQDGRRAVLRGPESRAGLCAGVIQ